MARPARGLTLVLALLAWSAGCSDAFKVGPRPKAAPGLIVRYRAGGVGIAAAVAGTSGAKVIAPSLNMYKLDINDGTPPEVKAAELTKLGGELGAAAPGCRWPTAWCRRHVANGHARGVGPTREQWRVPPWTSLLPACWAGGGGTRQCLAAGCCAHTAVRVAAGWCCKRRYCLPAGPLPLLAVSLAPPPPPAWTWSRRWC